MIRWGIYDEVIRLGGGQSVYSYECTDMSSSWDELRHSQRRLIRCNVAYQHHISSTGYRYDHGEPGGNDLHITSTIYPYLYSSHTIYSFSSGD